VNEQEQEPQNLTQTVVRGIGLAGGGYALAQVLTLAFFVVLARLASPSDFGDFAAGTLIVSVGYLFSESGMMAALIHRPDRLEEAASTATISTAVAGAAFGVAGLAISPLIGLLFDSSRVAGVAAASSGLLLLHPLQIVPEALLQRRFSFVRRVIVEPASVIAFGVTAIVLCANGLGVWGLVLGTYARALVELGLSWGLAGWRPQFRLASFEMWRELVRYGRYGVGASALERGSEQIPVVLIGHFAGAAQLGQYRYAQRIAATPLAAIVQGGSYVIFPALARITGNRDRFRGASVRSLRMMCAFSFPLGMILIPLGLPIAAIVFGEVWRDSGYAAMALSLFPVAGTLISFSSEVAKADGRPDIVTRTHAVNLVAGITCMAALLPFHLVGVAIGFGLGWLAGAIYSLSRVSGLLNVSRRKLFGETLPALGAGLVMVAVLTPLEFLVVNADSRGTLVGLALIVAQGLLGLIIYLGALRILAPEIVGQIVELLGRLRGRGAPAPEAAVPAAEAPESGAVPDEMEILDEPRL
jgi:O-antigen/teichoic acid export membrane protein